MAGNGFGHNGQTRIAMLDSPDFLPEKSLDVGQMVLSPSQMQQMIDVEVQKKLAEVHRMMQDATFVTSVASSAQQLSTHFNQTQNDLLRRLASSPGQSVRDRSTLRITIEET